MSHRPWPAPERPWAMRMRWCDLMFAHWQVDTRALRKVVPAALELDLFEGRAYVGAVPFRMEGVTPRMIPPVPGLHAFPELNLRTYVTAGGKPGVWFFSLDAGQRIAVRVARQWFHLPYFDAAFTMSYESGAIDYKAVRTHRGAAKAAFEARYRPLGDHYLSTPGTLESWLTERYCLYVTDHAGRVLRGEVDHPQWPLYRCDADIRVNTLGDWVGLPLRGQPDIVHFAGAVDVRAWLVEPIR